MLVLSAVISVPPKYSWCYIIKTGAGDGFSAWSLCRRKAMAKYPLKKLLTAANPMRIIIHNILKR